MAGSDDEGANITGRQKLRALVRVARYRPRRTLAIAVLSIAAAGLEAIGLSFILPIVEIADDGAASAENAEGIMRAFVTAYDLVGVPLTLETTVVGVSVVMLVRYSASFLASWARKILQNDYRRHLTRRTFEGTLDARVSYFDSMGSDDIINSVITQTKYGAAVLTQSLSTLERTVMALAYLSIGLYLAPELTVLMVVLLGLVTYLVRNVIEPGYVVGGRVADAGLVVPPENPESLARAAQTLSDGETARRFGENAREAVQTTYGWHRDAERLRDAYDGLEVTES